MTAYTTDFQTIGEKIKAERDKRGWTRKTLAAKTLYTEHYTEAAIGNWENDKNKPSESAIRALEKAFGTKLRK